MDWALNSWTTILLLKKLTKILDCFNFIKRLKTYTKEVLPPTENLSTLNNSTLEQSSTTQMLQSLNTVPRSDPLTMPSTSQTRTLYFPFQNLPLNEDPLKLPAKKFKKALVKILKAHLIQDHS